MSKQYPNLQVYLIADTSLCSNIKKLLKITDQATDAGVTCVQLRMKDSLPKIIAEVGQQFLNLLKPKNIPLIINDHIEVAKQINADGVHIGKNDITYQQARNALGFDKLVGLSIENHKQALTHQHTPADYFGVGPIFPTQTKLDAASPFGLAEFKRIKNVLAPKPVIAIGGINKTNACTLVSAQTDGIAIASAILLATNPKKETQTLRKLYEKI